MSKVYDWQDLGLQSMDIVGAAGRSPMSQAIVTAQKVIMGAKGIAATWTHIGGFTQVGRSKPTMQESTTLNKFSGQKGVQMNDFERWRWEYDGDIWIRKLFFERTPEFYCKDKDFWLEHWNDEYENGIPGALELAFCGLPFHKWIKHFFPNYVPLHTKEPHCTEHQGDRMLDVANLWASDVLTNKLPPHVWYSKIDMMLKCEISEPILIKEI